MPATAVRGGSSRGSSVDGWVGDDLAEARSRDEIQERAHEAANSEAVVHGMVTDLRRRMAR